MAKKEAKAGAASTTPAEDKKTTADASKKANARGGVRKASDPPDEKEELPPLSEEELHKSVRASADRLRSPQSADPNPMFDLTIRVNKAEAAEVNRLLSRMREEQKVKEGNPSPKAFLVNETGSDRVRWGGVTYTVPEGRNELTDAFVEANFPDGITADDLKKGLLGGRIKVEYEDPKAKPVVKPKSAKKASKKSKK